MKNTYTTEFDEYSDNDNPKAHDDGPHYFKRLMRQGKTPAEQTAIEESLSKHDKAIRDHLLEAETERAYMMEKTIRGDRLFDGYQYANIYPSHKPRIVWDSKVAYKNVRRKPCRGKIEAQAINVLSGGSVRENLRVTLKIGLDMARTEYASRPDFESFGELQVTRTGRFFRVPERIMRPKVLYLNTLTSIEKMANEMLHELPEVERWIVEGRKGLNPIFKIPFHTHTMPPGEVIPRLRALRRQIMDEGFNVLIINSHEFAATTARHRAELTNVLRDFAETLFVTVIVATHEPIPEKLHSTTSLRSPLHVLMKHAAQTCEISYSIEEVIEAAWDGAPITGSHASEESQPAWILFEELRPGPAFYDDFGDLERLGEAPTNPDPDPGRPK